MPLHTQDNEGLAAPAVARSKATKPTIITANIKDIQASIQDNILGVKLIVTSGLDMTRLLARYLHLSNTAELREFIKMVIGLLVVMAWVERRLVSFGCNNKNKSTIWPIKTLFRFIGDSNFISKETFEGGLLLNLEEWPLNNVSRGYASFIIAMQHIIRAYLDNFLIANAANGSKPLLNDIDIENWHRAY
jgi:hypothetical protein